MKFAVCLLALFLMYPTAAMAQVNPFADPQEEEQSDTPTEDPDEEEAETPDDDAEVEPVPETEPEPRADPAPRAQRQRTQAFDRVPISDNFSTIDIGLTIGTNIVGIGLLAFGPTLFDNPDPSMGSPVLGSVDYRISISQHGDLTTGDPMLWSIPAYTGTWVLPLGPGLFYGISALRLWTSGQTLLASQSSNIDHSFVAYAKTLGWTMTTAALTREFIGRPRPYHAFNRPEFSNERGDELRSFYSATTAMSFASASFIARDLSAHFRSSGGDFITGTILPYSITHALAALVAYGEIRDQRHYFSDVAIGAMMGSLTAHLVYSAHFDKFGQPRERLGDQSLSWGPSMIVGPHSTGWGANIGRQW